jgi:tryptophan-rich sensory protein
VAELTILRVSVLSIQLQMTSQIPLLEIQPAANYRTKASPLRIFMRPWHILQWMRDPEESIRKVLKFGNRDGPLPFQADSLLFPSTWPPLQLLTIVAMIHVIQRTLPSPPRALLRNFCIQRVLYEEWFRILFKERRVALGAVVSVLSFLAKVRLVHSTFTVDGVAGVLLTPAILASLVAGWMNVVLCNERIVARKKRAAAVTPTIRGPAIYASDNLDSQWDGEHIWETNG